jgi:hypothetical protein
MEPSDLMESEVKAFLEEGLKGYARALVALTEFRRRLKDKMISVLENFGTRLADIGLPIDGLKLEKLYLDELNPSATAAKIVLLPNQNVPFFTNYHINWDAKWAKDTRIRVGVYIWAKDPTKRSILYAALRPRQGSLKKATLSQDPNGLSRLAIYCDADLISTIEEPFRILVEDFVELLEGVDGIRRLLTS